MSAPDKNFEALKNDCKYRKLVLFVGAGINAGCLPSWNKLLNDLIDYTIHYALGNLDLKRRKTFIKWLQKTEDKNGLSYYEKGSLIKMLLRDQYIDVLYQKLYKENSRQKDLSFLEEVARLCINDQVHAVVSYNYDDLLEQAIRKKNKKQVQSIYGKKQLTVESDQLPIYHVHGFLPSESNTFTDESSIVLSYEEYYQTMIQTYSWQTAVQLHFLNSYTCLYIGISGRDFNMLRLLSYAQQYTQEQAKYILFCRESLLGYDTVRTGDDLKLEIRKILLEKFGLKLIYTGEKYATLTEYIKRIDNITLTQSHS